MNNGIRLAVKQDIPALCEIWKQCFNDSEDYIRCFYEENFERIDVLIYEADEKPVSMVNMIDAEFINKNESYKVKYIYAGGTLSDYRKKGYFTMLFKYTFERAKQNGYGLFLKPATQRLAKYFVTLGAEIDSYFRLVTIPPNKKLPLSAFDISYSKYNHMRNEAYSDIPFARWDDGHIRWCVKENEYYHGRTLKITLNKKDYFLMGYPEDNTLIINETDLSVNQLKQLSGALCDLFGTELIKAYLPDFSCDEGERIISSVVYNTPVCNTYVNLILI